MKKMFILFAVTLVGYITPAAAAEFNITEQQCILVGYAKIRMENKARYYKALIWKTLNDPRFSAITTRDQVYDLVDALFNTHAYTHFLDLAKDFDKSIGQEFDAASAAERATLIALEAVTPVQLKRLFISKLTMLYPTCAADALEAASDRICATLQVSYSRNREDAGLKMLAHVGENIFTDCESVRKHAVDKLLLILPSEHHNTLYTLALNSLDSRAYTTKEDLQTQLAQMGIVIAH